MAAARRGPVLGLLLVFCFAHRLVRSSDDDTALQEELKKLKEIGAQTQTRVLALEKERALLIAEDKLATHPRDKRAEAAAMLMHRERSTKKQLDSMTKKFKAPPPPPPPAVDVAAAAAKKEAEEQANAKKIEDEANKEALGVLAKAEGKARAEKETAALEVSQAKATAAGIQENAEMSANATEAGTKALTEQAESEMKAETAANFPNISTNGSDADAMKILRKMNEEKKDSNVSSGIETSVESAMAELNSEAGNSTAADNSTDTNATETADTNATKTADTNATENVSKPMPGKKPAPTKKKAMAAKKKAMAAKKKAMAAKKKAMAAKKAAKRAARKKRKGKKRAAKQAAMKNKAAARKAAAEKNDKDQKKKLIAMAAGSGAMMADAMKSAKSTMASFPKNGAPQGSSARMKPLAAPVARSYTFM